MRPIFLLILVFIGSRIEAATYTAVAPWQIPLIGTNRSQAIDYATTCDATHPATNFYLASGSGVVTRIRMVFQGGAASAYSKIDNVLCHIAYDGGADVANIPWSYFLGLQWSNRVDTVAAKADTEFFTIADVQGTILDFELTYPIPFTNGCTIWTTSTLGVSLASRVDYQNALASSPYSYMRFMVTNANVLIAAEGLPSGTVGFTTLAPTTITGVGTHFDATNVGHYVIVLGVGNLEIAEPLITAVASQTSATVSWGTAVRAPITANVSGLSWMIPTDFTWFNRVAGKAGFVASVTGCATNWANVAPNTRWFVNQESTPAAEWWDIEQFFGANNGFNIQPYQGREVGQTVIGGDGYSFGGYRHFFRVALAYSNGIRMMVNHQGDQLNNFPSAGNLSTSRMNFLTVFYE